jgi:putative DNA primase/helicase
MVNAGKPSVLGPDRAMVERTYDVLVDGAGVTELRLKTNDRHYGTAAGYFDNREDFVQAVLKSNSIPAPATWMLLNPARPELLARYYNRMELRAPHTTSDADIVRRRWILGDFDARRVADISATGEERQYVFDRMVRADETLKARHAIEAAVHADSGNGYHCLWRIEEPNDAIAAQLIERLLKALAKLFGDERVEIDEKVFNAARLTKVYGTPARKGDSIPERPHRLSALLKVAEPVSIVTREQLEEVAEAAKPHVVVNGVGPGRPGQSKEGQTAAPPGVPATEDQPGGGKNKKRRFNIDAFVAQHFPDAQGPELAPGGGRRWKLEICPFDPAHDDGKASVHESAEGVLGFHCFHRGCAGNGWRELRGLFAGGASAPDAAPPVESADFWLGPGGWPRAIQDADSTVSDPSPAPDLLSQPQTDWGNAQRLLAMFGRYVLYCPSWKCWLVWDQRRWKRDSTGGIRRLAKRMLIELLRQAITAETKRLVRFALASQDQPAVSRLIASAQDHAFVTPEQLDQQHDLLNCLNGVLDLRTGELRPHAMADYITRLVHYRYLPNAPARRWLKFLREILPVRLWPYLRRVLGYLLTGDVSARAVFIFFGGGNNGKTTLLSLVGDLLYEYAVVINPETLMASYRGASNNTVAELASLQGARYARTSECEAGSTLSQARIKALTQGYASPITAARKFENPFSFVPTHKIVIDTNPKPELRQADDKATLNRLYPLHFAVQIPEEKLDLQLPMRLREPAEMEGLLAWIVLGARRYYRSGLSKPQLVREALEAWRDESDTLARWREECCDIGRHYQARGGEAYASYKAWAQRNQEYVLTNKRFAASMRTAGYEPKQDRRGSYYSSLRLRGAQDQRGGSSAGGAGDGQVPF